MHSRGIQVVITAYNSSVYIKRCFDSIQNSLQTEKWMLVLLDDGSDDDTYAQLSILSKDFTTKLVKSEKAKNVAQAKNRALQLTHEFKEQYPYIMMMDIDDEMLPGRVKLLDFLIEKNEKFAVGNFYVTDLNKKVKEINVDMLNMPKFGSWATVFHQSLIKENENFFNEDFDLYEDIAKWWDFKLKQKEIKINYISSVFVHHYIRRLDSMTRIKNESHINKLRSHVEKLQEVCSKKPYNSHTAILKSGIYASLASIACRVDMLKDTVESIANQVDTLFVYLNGYESVPDFIHAYKNVRYILDPFGDLRAAAKFNSAGRVKGWHFICDDDIIYPENYIQKSIEFGKGKKQIFSYHGHTLKKDALSVWEIERRVRFQEKEIDSLKVDVGGTGVLFYHTDTKFPPFEVFLKYIRCNDETLGAWAHENKIDVITVPKEKLWIRSNPKMNYGLYEEKQINKNERQDLIEVYKWLMSAKNKN